MAMYMLGFITYGITLVFYASVFPRLARNTQKTKDARQQFDNGEISSADYETVEMLERNRLSSISTAHSNCTSSSLPLFPSSPLPLFPLGWEGGAWLIGECRGLSIDVGIEFIIASTPRQ
jgi:hypothetical protein